MSVTKQLSNSSVLAKPELAGLPSVLSLHQFQGRTGEILAGLPSVLSLHQFHGRTPERCGCGVSTVQMPSLSLSHLCQRTKENVKH